MEIILLFIQFKILFILIPSIYLKIIYFLNHNLRVIYLLIIQLGFHSKKEYHLFAFIFDLLYHCLSL